MLAGDGRELDDERVDWGHPARHKLAAAGWVDREGRMNTGMLVAVLTWLRTDPSLLRVYEVRNEPLPQNAQLLCDAMHQLCEKFTSTRLSVPPLACTGYRRCWIPRCTGETRIVFQPQ